VSKTKRKSGSTLDYQNIRLLVDLWSQIVNPELIAALFVQLTEKESQTFKVLKEHDPELLRLMRTWVQSTKIVADEIKLRHDEFVEIIKNNPEEYEAYCKAMGIVQESSSLFAEDAETKKMREEYENSGEFKLENGDAA